MICVCVCVCVCVCCVSLPVMCIPPRVKSSEPPLIYLMQKHYTAYDVLYFIHDSLFYILAFNVYNLKLQRYLNLSQTLLFI